MFSNVNGSTGIGVDIVDISRFRGLTVKKNARLLNKIFTKNELDYCFGFNNPAEHLAARWAGKEAVIKALNMLGTNTVGYKDIEIMGDDKGIPGVNIIKEGFADIRILLSLSHSQESAIAFTLATLKSTKQV
jgi:holo-[acyl-carrier protein] synthase